MASIFRQNERPGSAGVKDARPLLLLMLAALLLQVGGCASKSRPPVVTEVQPFTEEEREIWNSVRDAEYQLKIGDVFSVVFKNYSDLDQKSLVVLPDGRITMPGVEPTRAAGLTLTEFDSTLTALYEREYIDPDLSVIITSLGSSGAYVFGEVRHPGFTKLTRVDDGVLDVIALAGGFTSDASAGEVLHVRVTPDGYAYRHLDLSHLEKRAFMSVEAMEMQPNDLIYVPRSGAADFAYFSEKVLQSTLNVTQLFWDIYSIFNIDKVQTLIR